MVIKLFTYQQLFEGFLGENAHSSISSLAELVFQILVMKSTKLDSESFFHIASFSTATKILDSYLVHIYACVNLFLVLWHLI